jgi:hypothetical protein
VKQNRLLGWSWAKLGQGVVGCSQLDGGGRNSYEYVSLRRRLRCFGGSVRRTAKTETDTDNRDLQKSKPIPNRKTEKTDNSVRFGAVRFGDRFSVKKCHP